MIIPTLLLLMWACLSSGGFTGAGVGGRRQKASEGNGTYRKPVKLLQSCLLLANSDVRLTITSLTVSQQKLCVGWCVEINS